MNTGNIDNGYVCAKCCAWVSAYDIHYCFKAIPTPIQPYHTEHCYCRECDCTGSEIKNGSELDNKFDHEKCCMCGVRRQKVKISGDEDTPKLKDLHIELDTGDKKKALRLCGVRRKK